MRKRESQKRSPPLRSSSSPGPYMLISMPHEISTAVGFFQSISFLPKERCLMVAKKCNLTIVVCLFWCVKGDRLEGQCQIKPA